MKNKTWVLLALLSMVGVQACNGQKKMDKNAELKTEIDTVSYSIGVSIGENLKKQGIEGLNYQAIKQAMMDVMEKDGKPSIKAEEANMHIQKYFTAMMDRKADAAVAKGKEFLEKNGKREGVTTTASGLQYEVMKMGSGDKPKETDEVTVHYHGTLTDGKVFDSSVERGEPATFPLNGVIKGWTEALQLMPIGSKFKIFLPSDLAYGAQGAGEMIGPNETLIFEVELLKINKK
jgi:FKBP-type peptidyl-prolyl cis-trans isomerase FklB